MNTFIILLHARLIDDIKPVLREIRIGGLFMPLIQSLADNAGHVPIVSGYKSS